jgi:Flp pilus assembly protein TadD
MHPISLVVSANLYLLDGQKENAVLALKKAVKVRPCYFEAWLLLGQSYIELRNLPAALHAYFEASRVNPDDRRAWKALGSVYDLLGQKTFADFYNRKAAVHN